VAAIVAAAKLVGILQTPDSLRQKPNQEHQSKEEGETSSPAPLVRAGEARTDLAAAAACFAIRRDPTRVGKAARAWFLRLGWKNEIRGKVGDLYRDREDQIPSKSGFVSTGVESGSVACAGEEGRREALTEGSHRSERESMGPAGQREKRGREARLGWGDTGPRRELGRARGERGGGAGPRWRERKGEVLSLLLFFSFSFNQKPTSNPFKNLFEPFSNFGQNHSSQK
jgi:hypothetical protein